MKSLNKVQSHLIAECFNKLYIGGQFVDAIDGEKIPTYYPATGEFLHEFPRGKANDVDAAIAAAEAAWTEGFWAILFSLRDTTCMICVMSILLLPGDGMFRKTCCMVVSPTLWT